MEKEKKGATPESVREQVAQFAVHREPGERIAALENERQHLATEAHITRLEGRMDTSIAELKGHVDTSIAELKGHVDTRFAELQGEMDTRFAELKGELKEEMDTRFAELKGELKGEMDTRFAAMKEQLDAQAEAIRELGKMMRWMFGITVALLVAVVASMAGALVLLFLG